MTTIERWKETCRRGSLTAGDDKAFLMAFNRAFEGLLNKRRIGTLDGNVWVAENDGGNDYSRYGKNPQP
jgi:hypothetical protein